MGKREPVLRAHGPAMFRFLIDSYGFHGPEHGAPIVGQGVTLVYRRPGLIVIVETWAWKNESGIDTTLTTTSGGNGTVSASLASLYETCGLGSANDVPGGNSGGGHTTRKRIEQHANAMRAVIPRLGGPDALDVIRRASARS